MPELDLHIGVHKTATTFLQTVMQANIGVLNAGGVTVPHHRMTRKFLTVPCQLKAYQRLGQDWKTKYTDGELETIVTNFFAGLEPDKFDRILLTDENFVGHCGHIVRSGILYNRKKPIMQVLKEFLPYRPNRIFISFRDYAEFFSSVYAQYIIDVEAENYTPPEEFVGNVLNKYPNWVSFIDSVQETFPKSRIVVWSYEEARHNWNSVFDAMLGSTVARELERSDIAHAGPVRKSMSGRSLHEFLEMARRDNPKKAIRKLSDIRDKYDDDASFGKVNIFSDEQTELMKDRYKKHLDRLDSERKSIQRLC